MKRTSGRWASAIISSVLFFGAAFVAFSQTPGGTGVSPTNLSLINPLSGTTSVNGLVANIGAFMLALAVPICGIMVIVGAFQMMTAAGDPTKFSNGRKTLLYAGIGFVVVLFASSVVPLLKSILGG